jgi:DNA-binding transcriptional MerR regulator
MPVQKTILTEEMCEIVKNLKDQGLSVAKIKVQLNLKLNSNYGKDIIYDIFNKLEIPLKQKQIKNRANINCYNKEILEATKNFFEQKVTYEVMAEKLNITLSMVRIYLEIQNLTPKQNNYKNHRAIKEINQEHLDLAKNLFLVKKMSAKEVKEKFNELYSELNFGIRTINKIRKLITPSKDIFIKNSKDISCYNVDLLVSVKELFLQRKTINKMAEQLEIPRDRVKKYLKIQKLTVKNRDNIDRKSILIKRKLAHSVSGVIRNTLFKKNLKKDNKTFKALNYTPQQLKEHIESLFESWMNWENWGLYNKDTWNDNDQSTWVWNIDHKIPKSMFDYSSLSDQNFKDCWALSNLRPYSAKQNIIDGVNRTRHII